MKRYFKSDPKLMSKAIYTCLEEKYKRNGVLLLRNDIVKILT